MRKMTMEKIIDADNVKNFAYVNDGVCKRPIAGIVLDFFGLGNMSQYFSDTVDGEYYGERGILYVVPYTNPWAWMNKHAVDLTDEIIDVLFDKFELSARIPIVSSGGSMGGLSAIVYCAYAKRTPVACVADCPVCDAVYHYTERADLPRTMYSALYGYDGSLEDALKSISPVHLVDKLPKIDYSIFHCGADRAVDIARHSDIFVERMRKSGHSVEYRVIPDRDHCDLGYAAKKLYAKCITDAIERRGA